LVLVHLADALGMSVTFLRKLNGVAALIRGAVFFAAISLH
jgi:hypothetical protein